MRYFEYCTAISAAMTLLNQHALTIKSKDHQMPVDIHSSGNHTIGIGIGTKSNWVLAINY